MALYCASAPPKLTQTQHPHTKITTSNTGLVISCKQNEKNKSNAIAPSFSVDRRGILLGLGSLYGLSGQAKAGPLESPTKPAEHHHHHEIPNNSNDQVVDFEFPNPSTFQLRVRRPAHLVDDEFIAKYQEAIRRMKALPEDNPLNLFTYAKNHALHVHDTWLFFPWHRFYIYFFERVLGKLIDDPTFALPFWNYDAPEGMSVPALFADPSSTLFDPKRNMAHQPPEVIDFWYAYQPDKPMGKLDREDRMVQNVLEIRKAYRQSMARADLFHGEKPTKEPEEVASGGRIEAIHKNIHQWLGMPEAPWKNMGNPHLTTADPVFYSLHSNVDRLWHLYRMFRGNGPDFDDESWLNTSFKFCDENGRLVQVKIKDGLDPLKMGYTFENVPIPWAGDLHNPIISNINLKSRQLSPAVPINNHQIPIITVNGFQTGPKSLATPVRVLVSRPLAELKDQPRGSAVEVLHIKGINFVPKARFDVYIAPVHNDQIQHAMTSGNVQNFGEYAGSFTRPLPVHEAEEAEEMKRAKRRKAGLKVEITSILEDMQAENAENVIVTMVQTDGEISVDGVGIKVLPADRPLRLV